MKKREIDTAARFGLLDRLQALENDLMAIPGTTYIDFDLSGLYDRCPLCFVVGYDIDVRREDYFEARREWVKAVIMVFLVHDLHTTGHRPGGKNMKRYAIIKRGMEQEAANILKRPCDAKVVTGELLYYINIHELIRLYGIGAVLKEGN